MRTALKKDEKIIVVIHQHWLKIVTPIFAWIVACVLLIWFLPIATALLIALIAALFPLYEYINWKHNLWAVTNLRVVDESGFFSR
jgi:hypothetical protein